MGVEADLVAAIMADPDDEAPQLVIADWLMSSGDPRGELIVLDHRERTTPAKLWDADALERLLLLSAEYSFPRAREPDEATLPFVGGGAFPVQYELEFGGRSYHVEYAHHRMSVTVDDDAAETDVNYPDGFLDELDLPSSGAWDDEEKRVILKLVSDAIRAGTPLADLRFPYLANGAPLPVYDGGPVRGYRLPSDFRASRGLDPDRYGLAARDYFRWNAIWKRLKSIVSP